nr:cell division cycle 5-like protein [Tanacetum cinerariifolium]
AEAEAAAAANREDTKMAEAESEPQLREQQVEEANQITDSGEMANQTGQGDSVVVDKVNDESSNGQKDCPSEALHIVNDQDANLGQSQQIDATEVSVQAPMEILAVDSPRGLSL